MIFYTYKVYPPPSSFIVVVSKHPCPSLQKNAIHQRLGRAWEQGFVGDGFVSFAWGAWLRSFVATHHGMRSQEPAISIPNVVLLLTSRVSYRGVGALKLSPQCQNI